jgi:putative membrane protein
VSLQWWCSATGRAWEWVWRPYLGVWVAVLLLVIGWVRLCRSADPAEAWRPAERLRSALGALTLWTLLDWPVGALAGYLASVHMAQFLGITYVVAPLLLAGVSAAALRRLRAHIAVWAVLRRVTHPAAAFAIFNVVVVATHVPGVVDRLMTSQPGSFALDVAWLAAALVFWWPIVCPVPPRRGFPTPAGMLYLFLSGIPASVVGALLTFAERPAYAVYELAPRVEGLGAAAGPSAVDDQQVAGLSMWVGGGLITLLAITALFFLWSAREEAEDRRAHAGG